LSALFFGVSPLSGLVAFVCAQRGIVSLCRMRMLICLCPCLSSNASGYLMISSPDDYSGGSSGCNRCCSLLKRGQLAGVAPPHEDCFTVELAHLVVVTLVLANRLAILYSYCCCSSMQLAIDLKLLSTSRLVPECSMTLITRMLKPI
jgi:hypothetical protein